MSYEPYPGSAYAYCPACACTYEPLIWQDTEGYSFTCPHCAARKEREIRAAVSDTDPESCSMGVCVRDYIDDCASCGKPYCYEHLTWNAAEGGMICDNCDAIGKFPAWNSY